MTIQLGLSATEQVAYEAALAQPHRMRSIITVRDSNEKVITSFSTSSQALSGAVQVDATQDVSRELELAILKPYAQTSWAPSAPDDAAIFADNFLSATRGIYVDALARWVDVPVFWGPVTAANDNGDQLNVKASGKEIRGRSPYAIWTTLQIHAGTQRTVAIKQILDTIGETRYMLPEHSAKMGKAYSLSRNAEAWPAALQIAEGMDRQLFYNGAGYAQLRVVPTAISWTFAPGVNSVMTSKPAIDYDISIARNVVEVLGKDPKGRRPRIRAVARAPANHPLSSGPQGLGRNGKDVVLLERIENDMSTTKAAQALADRKLDELLMAAINVSFDCLPIPHLEENDIIGVNLNGNMLQFKLKQFTIPLTVGDTMSIGVNRRISVKRKVGA